MRSLIIFGAGGHAKVVADIALKNEYKIAGFLDDSTDIGEVLGYSVLGRVADCLKYADEYDFIIGIGNNQVRKRIFETYSELNYITLIHPTACVGIDVEVGLGTVVMPGAVINTGARIGNFCVVNSCAVVEHDCTVGEFTLLAPNSTVCGCVKIGGNVWLGAGSSVNNGLNICDGVTVGSGGVVVKNIEVPGTYVGVPVKVLK